jgi:hypothetical protein
MEKKGDCLKVVEEAYGRLPPETREHIAFYNIPPEYFVRRRNPR